MQINGNFECASPLYETNFRILFLFIYNAHKSWSIKYILL